MNFSLLFPHHDRLAFYPLLATLYSLLVTQHNNPATIGPEERVGEAVAGRPRASSRKVRTPEGPSLLGNAQCERS